jgi:hypothetical protein
MLLNEIDVEHVQLLALPLALLGGEHMLDEVGHRRDVAAGPHLQVEVRDLGGVGQLEHLERALRDDLHPSLHRLLQRVQHARAVGAGVLPEEEDGVACRSRSAPRCRRTSRWSS